MSKRPSKEEKKRLQAEQEKKKAQEEAQKSTNDAKEEQEDDLDDEEEPELPNCKNPIKGECKPSCPKKKKALLVWQQKHKSSKRGKDGDDLESETTDAGEDKSGTQSGSGKDGSKKYKGPNFYWPQLPTITIRKKGDKTQRAGKDDTGESSRKPKVKTETEPPSSQKRDAAGTSDADENKDKKSKPKKSKSKSKTFSEISVSSPKSSNKFKKFSSIFKKKKNEDEHVQEDYSGNKRTIADTIALKEKPSDDEEPPAVLEKQSKPKMKEKS